MKKVILSMLVVSALATTASAASAGGITVQCSNCTIIIVKK